MKSDQARFTFEASLLPNQPQVFSLLENIQLFDGFHPKKNIGTGKLA